MLKFIMEFKAICEQQKRGVNAVKNQTGTVGKLSGGDYPCDFSEGFIPKGLRPSEDIQKARPDSSPGCGSYWDGGKITGCFQETK